jgi:nudix-type nucleoside diphosphatase (YffH/AdpP family)
MTAGFFYGTMRHAPLRAAVLGHEPPTVNARLAGHRAFWVEGEAFPMILPGGDGTDGVLVPDLADEDVARLAFFEDGFGYNIREHAVLAEDGREYLAEVFFPFDDRWRPGAPWSFDDWVARWGPTAVAAAVDYMSHYPGGSVEPLRRRAPQMLCRAGARVRASVLRPGTESLRRRVGPGDVTVEALRHPYLGFFAVEERDLRFRRFDGSMSAPLTRAAFISGDASVVLPYDPVRDRVLLVEQFRAGPQARGDANPWLVETVAGRIDGGETPQDAARREAREEAGLAFRALIEGPRYYPSPAAKGEYIYSFVGLADLPDGTAGIGGVESEAEDIRSHVVSFTRLMELVGTGEIDNAPLLILAYWLRDRRAELRAAAGAGQAGA